MTRAMGALGGQGPLTSPPAVAAAMRERKCALGRPEWDLRAWEALALGGCAFLRLLFLRSLTEPSLV